MNNSKKIQEEQLEVMKEVATSLMNAVENDSKIIISITPKWAKESETLSENTCTSGEGCNKCCFNKTDSRDEKADHEATKEMEKDDFKELINKFDNANDVDLKAMDNLNNKLPETKVKKDCGNHCAENGCPAFAGTQSCANVNCQVDCCEGKDYVVAADTGRNEPIDEKETIVKREEDTEGAIPENQLLEKVQMASFYGEAGSPLDALINLCNGYGIAEGIGIFADTYEDVHDELIDTLRRKGYMIQSWEEYNDEANADLCDISYEIKKLKRTCVSSDKKVASKIKALTKSIKRIERMLRFRGE